MPDKVRHIITTADERTWNFDGPVLFLGEWCRRYDRRAVWEEMEYITAAPFGVQPGQAAKDLAYVQGLSSNLLIELSTSLNTFHNTSHSNRYWNILLGHWLQRYVAMCFNRYFTVKQALGEYKILSTTVLDIANSSLATSDSSNFMLAINNDGWNHILYARILSCLGDVETYSRSTGSLSVQAFNEDSDETLLNPGGIKSLILAAVTHVLPLFSRQSDAFIISSYLPRLQEVKLQLALKQCPQYWRRQVLQHMPFDLAMRQTFTLSSDGHAGFEQFVRQQLGDIIPTCYLEGYAMLCQQAESLAWPTVPKFIFTSNQFDSDEVFKAWAGSKVEKGTTYFTGQHGNVYGTVSGSQNWPECVTCDRFITWGWDNGDSKNIPSFVLKTAGKKPIHAKPDGGMVLVELCVPSRPHTDDRYFKFAEYQEDQFRFIESLPDAIHKKTRVRLFLQKGDPRWSERQRWSDRSPNTRLVAEETGDPTIWELYAQSRLVVFSYDSTGLLETLSLNIPTLCFWQDEFDLILPSAMPYYEMLKKAGIILEGPEEAAKQVALHWDNIEKWWHSEVVQSARELFCEQYARAEKRPIRTLKHLLTKDL